MPVNEFHFNEIPFVAASAINVGQAVKLDTGDVARQVLPLATNNVEPEGVALATAAAAAPVTVEGPESIVKVVAAASVGHGGDVGVATTNGALGPVTAGASGSVVFRVGRALSAAAAGETFALQVKPRQLSGSAP